MNTYFRLRRSPRRLFLTRAAHDYLTLRHPEVSAELATKHNAIWAIEGVVYFGLSDRAIEWFEEAARTRQLSSSEDDVITGTLQPRALIAYGINPGPVSMRF